MSNGNEELAAYFENDGIDFLVLWGILWKGKWIIFGISSVFAIFSVFYALSLPNIYRSEVLLSPVEDESSSSNSLIGGQLGGLASLAGVSLGGAQSNDTVKAMAVLKSRTFIKQFFENHNLLVPFMASMPVKRSRSVEIDPSLYDVKTGAWVRDFTPPQSLIPSDWEVYEAFSETFSVSQDSETGLVTVSIEWFDPEQIKQWIDWLVEDLNEHMKEKDLIETQKAIEYLEVQLNKTSLVGMRNVFYSLIESQTQKSMLANIKDEYSFEQIDPAVVAEDRSSPHRSLICVLITFLGGILGLLIVFIRHGVIMSKPSSK